MKRQDAEVIERARQGDPAAMAELFQQHYSFLHKYLLKISMNSTLAEDIAQDTVLRCMEHLHRYNGTSSFSSWMITIGTRIYLDKMRRRKRERAWFLKEKEQGLRKLKWQLESGGDAWNEMLESLSTLSDDHRIAILLKHYYGYSYDEIGEMLGIPAGTVKSRASYGIQSLRKELKRHV
ncbi:RNA polymerase sigma factor SigY [Paenibacillus sp. JSM ZJ436]|uniref:RNA polymerase sigma factor SigY n=1 Tax=Paenibacillus sp. JSM ZJ436 TaxID=3376190 RepID=UPI003790BF91